MKTRELFVKDPLSWRLLNEGVSSNNSLDLDTLRYELQTFVCSGEYHQGLSRILQNYLDSLGKEQKAAWVSGFYGSGKSHLVKVLRFLWTDYRFPDGMTARNLAERAEGDRRASEGTEHPRQARRWPPQRRRHAEGRRGQRPLEAAGHPVPIGRPAGEAVGRATPHGSARRRKTRGPGEGDQARWQESQSPRSTGSIRQRFYTRRT